MQFDLEKAVAILGGGTGGPITAIGMGFGLPLCLIELTEDVLNALPGSILTGMSKSAEEGRRSAREAIQNIVKKIFLGTGIIEFDTESGTLRLVSAASRNGLDEDEYGFFKGLEAIVGAAAFGAALWTNIENIDDQIDQIIACIGKLEQTQKFADGNSAYLMAGIDFDPLDYPTVDANYTMEKERIASASQFAKKTDKLLKKIATVLETRRINPALEPCFLDNPIFSGVDFCIREEEEIKPFESVFDLVYGPPKSKKGKFIFSIDGLYYDYQNSGVYDISTVVPPDAIPMAGDRWKFEHDPNLGGKGDAVSLKELNEFFSTIFDLSLIDNSDELQEFYDNDHFLQTIRVQRDKHIYDLSGELRTYEDTSGTNNAMVVNLKNSIFSQIASHTNKINKRKKQIEIAVKAPIYYGNGQIFNIGDKIPINDFSFLSGVIMPLALEKQRQLVFNQGEVSGIILPLIPTFVVSPDKGDKVSMNHLLVPTIGIGSIMMGASSFDASQAAILSLTDGIITNGLEIIYNFLEPKVVKKPGSTEFQVLNCASYNLSGNAQLVANSTNEVFFSGLGIPYLKGIGEFSSNNYISSIGSYIRLPDTPRLRNLTYNPDGFAFDFWVYVSSIADNDALGWDQDNVSSLHRLILGCENTGGTLSYSATYRMPPFFGSDTVRGMVMGFTRDRQIVVERDPTPELGENLAKNVCFYIAPTQSVNTSDVMFINNRIDSGTCPSGPGWYMCKVSVSSIVNGKSIGDVSSNFIHMAVSVDPKKNRVQIFVDKELMVTSGIHEVFGIDPYSTPNLPSFYQISSFEYNSSNMGQSSPLKSGPPLNNRFTPWILGGGYTDGHILDASGFMNPLAGMHSGLYGHIGSFKIYTRAITHDEVRKNYDAQQGFFKNIAT